MLTNVIGVGILGLHERRKNLKYVQNVKVRTGTHLKNAESKYNIKERI